MLALQHTLGSNNTTHEYEAQRLYDAVTRKLRALGRLASSVKAQIELERAAVVLGMLSAHAHAISELKGRRQALQLLDAAVKLYNDTAGSVRVQCSRSR